MVRIVAFLAGMTAVCLAVPAGGAILSATPDWAMEGDVADINFGWSVATAGDVNCDGFSDIIVSAYDYTNGEASEGRAYVFHGSLTGPEMSAAWTAEGNQINAHFGDRLATAGDVDGNTCSDVMVASSGYDNPEASEGRVWVYHGTPGGLETSPSWSAEGNQDSAVFGRYISTAGDVDSDGYSDIVVVAPGLNSVFVYHGSITGLSLTDNWSYLGEPDTAAAAGDVDGDGFADLVVGESGFSNPEAFEGRIQIFRGSATGLEGAPSWTAEGNLANANLGSAVSTAGDVNGDGYADVLVAAYNYENDQTFEGAAMVYHGSTAGLSATPDWLVEGNCSGCGFAIDLSTAGDVNGDGYADVLVGAWLDWSDDVFEGRIFVWLGSAGGLSTSPDWIGEGDLISASLGRVVSLAGDVNGDGFSDIIAGASAWSNPESDEGQARIYFGSAEGLSPNAGWSGLSGQANATFGASVASAGDVNGDSFSDVIVGAPGYDTTHPNTGRAFVFHGSPTGLDLTADWDAFPDEDGANFGWSVASAGDVDADGYSDVVVGSPGADLGAPDSGRVYVYHGSPGGLSMNHSWDVGSLHAAASMGHSVASAGDVNGDGYADIVVGSPGYQNGEVGEGRAFVVLGSAGGLCDRADWIAEGNAAGAALGTSVASAGDVNRDGYSDVIVGSPSYSDINTSVGRAQLYLGGALGLSLTQSWWVLGNNDFEALGQVVASAGDVDRDGYSDVLVGVPGYSNGEYREGRALLFNGTSIMAGTTVPDWAVEADDVETMFGSALASAGDVNGDGYSDVIVGGPAMFDVEVGEGLAFVYLGGPGGLAPTPDWTADSDQDNAGFGHSVACAGDINADGYSDVIVGARDYASEGAAFLFYGNRGPCNLLYSQQYRTNASTPVQLLGTTHSSDSVVMTTLLNPAAGRTRVQVITQLRALGDPLDLSNFFDGSWADSEIPPLLVSNAFIGFPMVAGSPYHWRVRLQQFPFLDFGRWVSAGPNGAEETDFRTRPSCSPIGADANCDGVDDDCDGPSDEDYIPDDTCGQGYCLQTNTPSSCLSSTEFACQPGTPLAPTDTTCDLVDDDCDGLVDDEADAGCNDGNVCTLNTCDPAQGCQTAFNNGAPCTVAGCDGTCLDGLCDGCTCTQAAECDDEVDCTADDCTGGMCINLPDHGSCNDGAYCNGQETCHPQAGCLAGIPPDCDDGIACTADLCDEDLDVCSPQVSAGLCLIGGACTADGSVHPQDPCRACRPEISQANWSLLPPGTACGESSCQDEIYSPAPTCDASGVCLPGSSVPCQGGCADEYECQGSGSAEGDLHISRGTGSTASRVRADLPGIVMRLNLRAEAVPGRLESLTLHFPGLENIPTYWRWVRVSVHLDGEPYGQELGGALLADGVAWIENLNFNFGGLTEHDLLVVMSVIRPEAAAAGVRLGPWAWLAAAGLLTLLLINRRRLRRAPAALLLAFTILAPPACSRYGYLKSFYQTRALLQSANEVEVSAHPDDRLTVVLENTPAEGDSFTLDLSR